MNTPQEIRFQAERKRQFELDAAQKEYQRRIYAAFREYEQWVEDLGALENRRVQYEAFTKSLRNELIFEVTL